MDPIILPIESFKFLINNRLVDIFESEINMQIADEILDKYEYLTSLRKIVFMEE